MEPQFSDAVVDMGLSWMIVSGGELTVVGRMEFPEMSPFVLDSFRPQLHDQV